MSALFLRNASFLLLSSGLAVSALARPAYPPARTETIEESHFGVTYADSFRWMENLDDPELGAWIRAENQFTKNTLGSPVDVLAREFEDLLSPAETEEMDRSFQRHRRLQERFSPFADPDGLGGSWTSPSGTYSVRTGSDSGSDLADLQIFDAAGKAQGDVLHVKHPTVVWESDDTFLYVSDRDGRLGDSTGLIRSHKIGTKQSADRVIFEAKKAIQSLNLYKVGGRYILLQWVDDKTSIDVLDIASGALTSILAPTAGSFSPFDIRGDKIYIVDYRHAPMGEIITFDLSTGLFATVVPAQAHALDQVALVGDQIFLTLLEDVESKLFRFDAPTRTLASIPLPGPGTANLYGPESVDGFLTVAFSSYTEKTTEWHYDPAVDALIQHSGTRTPPFPLEASKTFYTAHDGRRVPIWLVRRQGTPLTPSTPMYLYGYGGFSINILPSLSRDTQPWLKRGGVVAVATLPGGLEYGEDWHNAGALANKRNVFDDFAAAARHLIASGYTSSDKLAISGGSNGGLLVGATANLYPDLFRVAVPEVGVMDLTKFQLFTGGKWWVYEYGDREDRAAFLNQYALSPYHNLVRRVYPATLVMTADADDRVVPSHSYKYAARLQQYQDDSRLALLWTHRGGSHGWSTGTVRNAALGRAVKWAFIMQELGVTP